MGLLGRKGEFFFFFPKSKEKIGNWVILGKKGENGEKGGVMGDTIEIHPDRNLGKMRRGSGER